MRLPVLGVRTGKHGELKPVISHSQFMKRSCHGKKGWESYDEP